MERPKLPQAARQVVYLAYTQQLENIREAKRLQWHMTYLGVGALVVLGGAYQLLRQWSPDQARLAAQVLAVFGGVIAVVTSLVIETASQVINTHRQTLVEIAGDLEQLDELSEPYLTRRLGIPEDYGRRRLEPRSLQLALCIAAGVLAWVLSANFVAGVVAAVLTFALAASLILTCIRGCVWW